MRIIEVVAPASYTETLEWLGRENGALDVWCGAVNVVSINLAAKVVCLIKGVRPRTWLEKRKARQSVRLAVTFWVVTLLFLLLAIPLHSELPLPDLPGLGLTP